MSSIVSGLIEQLQLNNGTIHNIASTAYGICESQEAESQKTVDMTGFNLVTGVTIHIKFLHGNSANSPTLNVNGTGAKILYEQ